MSTVYTLEVTDANGCMQAGQATVVTYQADSGVDADVCAGEGVTIGEMALMGVPSVPAGGTPPAGEFSVGYSWSPSTGLSCSDCPNPVATPTTAQTYILTTTIYYPDGTSCQTDDMINVNVIEAPSNAEFAGADRVICFGETPLLGTAPEGFMGPFLAQASGSTTTSANIKISNQIPNARNTTSLRDVNGKVIIRELLLSDNLQIGDHLFPMNLDQLPGGVYTLDVTINQVATSQKLIVID
jgi:hypothetical protein